jgi:hypothetical protein
MLNKQCRRFIHMTSYDITLLNKHRVNIFKAPNQMCRQVFPKLLEYYDPVLKFKMYRRSSDVNV